MNALKLYILGLILALTIPLRAEVRIVASAPAVVAQGEQFQIEYQVNTQNVKSFQTITKFPGFELLYGPSRASSYSVQIINGHQSSVSTITFAYTLMGQKSGSYTLPSMSINVGGTNYKSNTVNVKVVASSNASTNSGRSSNSALGGGNSSQPAPSQSNAAHISNKDLFITVTANKSSVYEQEPILLTYRVYTRLNLTQLEGKMPDLKGFMVKEIPLTQQKSFSVAEYNGQNYYTTVWSQYVMFPQQTGKLTIPSIKFDGVIVFHNPNVDLLDEFFNGNTSSIQRKKTVMAPALNINVQPLPNKPQNFSGAVGNFTIKSVLKTPKIRENETLDMQLQISGTGNIDLIKAPDWKLPSDFDVYPPKQNAQSKLTTNGSTGTMTIDYVAVPKHQGKYTLPAIEFVYFDTNTHTYKTLTTSPTEINVGKGEKNIYSDKQQEILARSDIRFIKNGTVELHHQEDLFWGKKVFWICYAVAFLLFVIAFVYLHRQLRLSHDSEGRRVRGASRVVTSRLKKAHKLLNNNHTDAFYDEILHALIGYVSDKLSIPMSDLSKERLLSEFDSQNIDKTLSQQFIQLQSDCEFYRFSPSAVHEKSPADIYQEAMNVIGKLDSVLKKKRK